MFLEVIAAEYLREYLIKVTFNNGEIKLVDLSESLQGEIFESLKDTGFFRDFIIHFNTLEWKNGADFAPEYLYRIGKPLTE
ncbi:MAG: DUF2442 domain-containing protein [Bacteroidetes bacterium]|nr:DUF2442 domain-containing protein [Bacteroidota bacterium]